MSCTNPDSNLAGARLFHAARSRSRSVAAVVGVYGHLAGDLCMERMFDID